jgi:DNA-binding Lrp family transcriptional regulator
LDPAVKPKLEVIPGKRKKPSKKGFSPLMDGIAQRRDISAQAKLIHALLRRLQGLDVVSFPSYAGIAHLTGCSRLTAIRRIRELEAAGLLEVLHTSGKQHAAAKNEEEDALKRREEKLTNLYRVYDEPHAKAKKRRSEDNPRNPHKIHGFCKTP